MYDVSIQDKKLCSEKLGADILIVLLFDEVYQTLMH